MEKRIYEKCVIDGYYGCIADLYKKDHDFNKFLTSLSENLKTSAKVISHNYDAVFLLDAPFNGKNFKIVVKSFKRRGVIRDKFDLVIGSRAARAWYAGMTMISRKVKTPQPIAFLDKIINGRITESYFITEFAGELSNFRDELISLYANGSDSELLMLLLQRVAESVCHMHDAGILHNDLGNQNILLRKNNNQEYHEVLFADLNRVTVYPCPLTYRQRARDISRIALPADFLRIFIDMYFERVRPPPQFHRWENFYRRLYSFHHKTRKLRHPSRLLKDLGGHSKDYQPEGNIWIWDDKSSQPLVVLSGKDKIRNYPIKQHVQLVSSPVLYLPSVLLEYRRLKEKCFSAPVPVEGKVGIGLEPQRETWEKELAFLENLKCKNVLIRFYRHKRKETLKHCALVAKHLKETGYSIVAALVQDRYSVNNTLAWSDFIKEFLELCGECIERIEIGHAVNRVKWGIWSFDEYGKLAEITADLATAYKNIQLMGPSVIDFDPASMVAALHELKKKNVKLDSATVHLYVDRRGAPENRQNGFSCVEKFVLCKAISVASKISSGKLVISEFNWPIEGTGTYSPVGSPYESPGPHIGQPNVSEEEQAAYMLRYILIAIASGMVEQLFWWRLAAHGYGLVDNIGNKWRVRPAYRQMKAFLDLLSDGLYVGRIKTKDENVWLLEFDMPGNRTIYTGWTDKVERKIKLPFDWSEGMNAEGEIFRNKRGEISLSSSPVYIFRDSF